MPSGYPFPRWVRRQLFDLVCQGMPVHGTERTLGVSIHTGWLWWRDAGAMKLRKGRVVGGLANPGDWSRPGGAGHRLSGEERIVIMRDLDAGLRPAE